MPRRVQYEIEMVAARHATRSMHRSISGQVVAPFPLSMSLEPRKELLNLKMAHVVPSEQVSVNQQRAAWLRATGEGTALCSEGYHTN